MIAKNIVTGKLIWLLLLKCVENVLEFTCCIFCAGVYTVVEDDVSFQISYAIINSESCLCHNKHFAGLITFVVPNISNCSLLMI